MRWLINIILIFTAAFTVFLIWRILNKVKAQVKYDTFDDNLFIEENNQWYNVDYGDLFYYNTRRHRIDNFIEDMFIPIEIIDVEPVTIGFEEIPPELIRDINGGSQNVHDTFVQETVKKAHKDMIATPYASDNFIEEINKEFKDEKISKILNKIKRRKAHVSNINKTEIDVLRDTWNAANKDENLKEEFKNQLLDCEDKDGNLVCGTGVVTRLTSSLFINNPEEMPKTKEMINQEVLNTFSKMYTGKEDKHKIKEQIMSTYPEPSMKKKVGDLIDEWIDHV